MKMKKGANVSRGTNVMSRSKLVWLQLLLAIMLLLSACGAVGNTNNTTNNTANETTNGAGQATNNVGDAESEEEVSSLETVYPLTVVDITNTEITFEAAPTVIVSLLPSETEVVYAAGGGNKVVGVDDYSNYPEEALTVEKIGDMYTNIEKVASLNPDLVLASESMNAEAIQKLRELNIPVYASNPRTYDEVVAHIEQIGVILNTQEQAVEVTSSMKAVKEDVTTKLTGVEPRKVYLELGDGWTVGSGEFLDELVTLAGGINISGEQSGWFEVDAEAVVEANPEVIIYPDWGEEQSSIVASIMVRPGWDVIDAVQNDNMVKLAEDPMVRVGPRLAQGLADVAKAIHPELFN